jgi:hypothetical protein
VVDALNVEAKTARSNGMTLADEKRARAALALIPWPVH